MNHTIKSITNQEEKYLTFSLAGEEYGVRILKVKEIIGMMPITPLPKTPRFVRGVINLRGKVIPVIDLKVKFGLQEAEPIEKTCIIVMEIQRKKEAISMGIMVDSVSEVISIKASDIEAASNFGFVEGNDYIQGMAKLNGRVKILLNIENILLPRGNGVADEEA